jgi:hypothetical protein
MERLPLEIIAGQLERRGHVRVRDPGQLEISFIDETVRRLRGYRLCVDLSGQLVPAETVYGRLAAILEFGIDIRARDTEVVEPSPKESIRSQSGNDVSLVALGFRVIADIERNRYGHGVAGRTVRAGHGRYLQVAAIDEGFCRRIDCGGAQQNRQRELSTLNFCSNGASDAAWVGHQSLFRSSAP